MNKENNRGQQSGAQADPGKKGANATGRGLNHGKNLGKREGKKAGRRAKRGLKNAPRKMRSLKNNAEKGAGYGMQGAGKGMRGAGKATNGAGKGVQGAGKALGAIPYAGPALNGAVGGLGKGMSGAGKGTDKAGKGLDNAGRKVRMHAKRKQKANNAKKNASLPAKILAKLMAHIGMIGGLLTLAIVSILLISAFGMAISDDDSSCAPSGDDGGSAEVTGSVGGMWTHKGTRPYSLNKQVYAGAIKLGFNSNLAAGVVGNSVNEGGGNLNAKGTLDFGETDPSHDGGKGIFQFTPGVQGGGTLETYEAWCRKNGYKPWQSAYVEIKGLASIKGALNKLKHIHTSDPAEGARQWYLNCEDAYPNGSYGQRQADAKKAYEVFNGTAGSAGDAESNADSGDGDTANPCGDDSGDTADGTGSVKEKVWSAWKPNEVPDDVKKYIHDPTKVGMKYGSTKGWSDVGAYPGQCVNFANSYYHAIWGLKPPFAMGMGGEMADNWNSKIPGSTENSKPRAGAIAGTRNTALTGGGSAGHTFVVQHVLANGDFLIAEENMTWSGKGYSGTYLHGYNSMQSTWNYQLLPKNLSSTKYTTPPTNKYHLKWSR